MDNAIHTLHQFMLRTESLTYILVVAALVALPFFWRVSESSGTTTAATGPAARPRAIPTERQGRSGDPRVTFAPAPRPRAAR